jgi:hypothetical protein
MGPKVPDQVVLAWRTVAAWSDGTEISLIVFPTNIALMFGTPYVPFPILAKILASFESYLAGTAWVFFMSFQV